MTLMTIASKKAITAYNHYVATNQYRYNAILTNKSNLSKCLIFSEKSGWNNFDFNNQDKIESFTTKLREFLKISPENMISFNEKIECIICFKVILMNRFELSEYEQNIIFTDYDKTMDELIELNNNHNYIHQNIKEELDCILKNFCDLKIHTEAYRNFYSFVKSIIFPIAAFTFDNAIGVYYDYQVTETYFCSTPAIDSKSHCDIDGKNLIISVILSALCGAALTGSLIEGVEKLFSCHEKRQDLTLKNKVLELIYKLPNSAQSNIKKALTELKSEDKALLLQIIFYLYEFLTDAIPSYLPQLIPQTPKDFYSDFSMNSKVGICILIGGSILYNTALYLHKKYFSYSCQKPKTPDYSLNESLIGNSISLV
jgi:hypothetical protein